MTGNWQKWPRTSDGQLLVQQSPIAFSCHGYTSHLQSDTQLQRLDSVLCSFVPSVVPYTALDSVGHKQGIQLIFVEKIKYGSSPVSTNKRRSAVCRVPPFMKRSPHHRRWHVTMKRTYLRCEHLWEHRCAQSLWTLGEGDGQGEGEFQLLPQGTEMGWHKIPSLSLAPRMSGTQSIVFHKPHVAPRLGRLGSLRVCTNSALLIGKLQFLL